MFPLIRSWMLCALTLFLFAHVSVQQGGIIAQPGPNCPQILCMSCDSPNLSVAARAGVIIPGCPGCPPCPNNPKPNICAMVLCAPNCKPAYPPNPSSPSECCVCTPVPGGPG